MRQAGSWVCPAGMLRHQNFLVVVQEAPDPKTQLLKSCPPMSETAGRMRMMAALGGVNLVHQAESPGRKIRQHEFAAGLQDPQHFAEDAFRIVQMMADVPRSHRVETVGPSRQGPRVGQHEINAFGNAHIPGFQPGCVLFLGVDVQRCDPCDMS